MEQQRVLIVDDEESIASAIAYALKREGFSIETACNGKEALQKAETFRPHVMVLDVMMPVMNGYDVCRSLSGRPLGIGILLLTAKNDIVDKVLGLELGADDFLSKPFDLRELTARVKALARRIAKQPAAEHGIIHNGRLAILTDSRIAKLSDEEIELTPKEFDLLALLVQNTQKVYTRDDLLELVWGIDYAGGTRTVDIHIQRLRKKLGDSGQAMIQTVYGIGYKAIEMP